MPPSFSGKSIPLSPANAMPAFGRAAPPEGWISMTTTAGGSVLLDRSL